MFTKFYELRLFIVDEIVSHGLEHDNGSVRLMSVKIIPRVLKGIRKSRKPSVEEMFGLLLVGTIGRVRGKMEIGSTEFVHPGHADKQLTLPPPHHRCQR
jgi:hypothetical protein